MLVGKDSMFSPRLALSCIEYLLFMRDGTGKTMPMCEEYIVQRWDVDGIEFAIFRDPLYVPPVHILVFPGLNDRDELKHLMNCRYRQRSEGGVFSSLRSAFCRIQRVLETGLRLEIEITRLVITGYSTGAVLATYAAFYWAMGAVESVYLFASPRPGDENFNNSYDDELYELTYRVCLPGDVITHVPVNGWHVGQPILLHKSIEYGTERSWFDHPFLWWLTPAVLSVWWASVLSGFVENWHNLHVYYRLLKSHNSQPEQASYFLEGN